VAEEYSAIEYICVKFGVFKVIDIEADKEYCAIVDIRVKFGVFKVIDVIDEL
jgi:hypothetical protein